MSVSLLPMACGRQGRYSCSQVCVIIVSWENYCQAQNLTCVVSKVLKSKHVCAWVQCGDDLQWLMAKARAAFRKCWAVEPADRLLPFPWVSAPCSCLHLESAFWKQTSCVAPRACHSLLSFVVDYSLKRREDLWLEKAERAKRRYFGMKEAREGNSPFDRESFRGGDKLVLLVVVVFLFHA